MFKILIVIMWHESITSQLISFEDKEAAEIGLSILMGHYKDAIGRGFVELMRLYR